MEDQSNGLKSRQNTCDLHQVGVSFGCESRPTATFSTHLLILHLISFLNRRGVWRQVPRWSWTLFLCEGAHRLVGYFGCRFVSMESWQGRDSWWWCEFGLWHYYLEGFVRGCPAPDLWCYVRTSAASLSPPQPVFPVQVLKMSVNSFFVNITLQVCWDFRTVDFVIYIY